MARALSAAAKAKAAKAKAKPSSSVKPTAKKKKPETSDDESVAPKPRAKFQEMRVIPDPQDLRAGWRMWKRSFSEWSNQNFDEATKVASLLNAMTREMQALVFNRIPTTITTIAEVFDVLEGEYASDEKLVHMADIQAYQQHMRGKESLKVWLSAEQTLRLRYEEATGKNDHDNGHQFMLKAGLSVQEQTELLRHWTADQRRMKRNDSQPTVSEIERELKDMLLIQDLNSAPAATTVLMEVPVDKKTPFKKKRQQKPKKWLKEVKTVLTSIQAAVAGASASTPGLAPASAAASKLDWICSGCGKRVFSDRTSCFFCSKAKSSADAHTSEPRRAATTTKGGGKGKGTKSGPPAAKAGPSTRVCHFFAKGTCKNGESCKFVHQKSEG